MPDTDTQEARAPEVEFETTVAGKKVQFRRRFPAKDFANLFALQVPNMLDDAALMIRFMSKLIESWEFDGDPSRTDAYADLDMVDELYPLYRASDRYLGQRIARINSVKN